MIRKLGKKGLEWKRVRYHRLKRLAKTGKYEVVGTLLFGPCARCDKWRCLDTHHKFGRDIDDPHNDKNLEDICRKCHMKEEKKPKNKKPKWASDHQCINCKKIVSTLLCPECNKISVKV